MKTSIIILMIAVTGCSTIKNDERIIEKASREVKRICPSGTESFTYRSEEGYGFDLNINCQGGNGREMVSLH